jgi:hypothetical protein
VVVNATNTFIVPLLAAVSSSAYVPYAQGFLTVVLNGVVVWLTTESQNVPSR